MLKIALIFHSASNDNMGVGALSVSEVAILTRIFDAFERRAELVKTQRTALETGQEKLDKYEVALGNLMSDLNTKYQ